MHLRILYAILFVNQELQNISTEWHFKITSDQFNLKKVKVGVWIISYKNKFNKNYTKL
jgi:hypothetical protein